MFRKIITYPAKILKEISEPVTDFAKIKNLAEDLIDTCNVSNGAGLAASQIGESKQILVIKPSAFGLENPEDNDINKDYLIVINPEIIPQGDDVKRWNEQCLSVPNIDVKVERKENIILKYFNLNGEEQFLKASWPFSAGLQHEYDHLIGKLVLDRCNKKLKSFYVKRYHKRNK
jgi:peptide deformylase